MNKPHKTPSLDAKPDPSSLSITVIIVQNNNNFGFQNTI